MKLCRSPRRPTRFYLTLSYPRRSWPGFSFVQEIRRGVTEMLAKLGPPTAFGVSRALAQFYSITGEIEKAADWCERAIKEGDGNVAVGTTFPLYKPLRESPRWPQLAKMMNLPEGV